MKFGSSMRWLLLVIYFASSGLFAQGRLTAVSADIALKNSEFKVQQQLQVDLDDTIQYLDLKALSFKGSALASIAVYAEDTIDYEVITNDNLTHLRLSLDQPQPAQVSLTYIISVEQQEFYLPLFYTNLQTTSSENDFFQLSVSIPPDQAFYLHFPAVPFATNIKDSEKTITLQLPALPSVIRMELLDNNAPSPALVRQVDWGVALIFMIIAFLIWRNRKRLING